MAKRRKLKTLPPVHPNVGIEKDYQRRIERLADQMANSVEYWLRASYRQNEPNIAMDDLPAAALQRAIKRMTRVWQRKWNDAADDLARYFAKSVRHRNDAQLASILKRAGWSVRFKTTPVMQDVMRATVAQNVQLIRSIPQQYLTQVQGIVMRGVQTGRDLGGITDELQEQFGVTRRRAALIARDQNNKATSAMQKARQQEVGIKEGIWIHSHAGKEPRPTHVANNGKRFRIDEGWYDNDPRVKRYIMPGELINCRCMWKAVIPGFT